MSTLYPHEPAHPLAGVAAPPIAPTAVRRRPRGPTSTSGGSCPSPSPRTRSGCSTRACGATTARCRRSRPSPAGTIPCTVEVPPAQFVPAAESVGTIAALTDWLVAQATHDARSWPQLWTPVPRLLVNVSGSDLQRHGLAEQVLGHCRDSGLAPERLGVEITESVALADLALAKTNLDLLAAEGVGRRRRRLRQRLLGAGPADQAADHDGQAERRADRGPHHRPAGPLPGGPAGRDAPRPRHGDRGRGRRRPGPPEGAARPRRRPRAGHAAGRAAPGGRPRRSCPRSAPPDAARTTGRRCGPAVHSSRAARCL